MQDPIKKYSPEVLKVKPSFGVLEQLEGTWVNHNPDNNKTGWGLHTTCMPSPGSNSETIPGKFHFVCEDYKEELTFTLVKDSVRNRGGANEQFCGAVMYQQSIQDLNRSPLHVENGMYLYLDELYNHEADAESVKTDIGYPELKVGDGANGPNYKPAYSISRSGTIPHGSTILLFGKNTTNIKGKPEFPYGVAAWDHTHLAISPSMGLAGTEDPGQGPIDLDLPAPPWVHDKSTLEDPGTKRAYTQRILAHELYPYSVRPDFRLRDAIKNQNIKRHDLISLTTKEIGGPEGGVLNTPFVKRFSPVTEVNFDLWIETVIEDGQEILQLQYRQIMFFEFQFGFSGETTRWPHIQINTLRKKKLP